jgi:hypothetical protein
LRYQRQNRLFSFFGEFAGLETSPFSLTKMMMTASGFVAAATKSLLKGTVIISSNDYGSIKHPGARVSVIG